MMIHAILAPTRLRRLFILEAPLPYTVLLLFHPLALGHALGNESIYEALSDHAFRWLAVHVAQLFFIGLMPAAVYLLVAALRIVGRREKRGQVLPHAWEGGD
jgi:hypothetical protein